MSLEQVTGTREGDLLLGKYRVSKVLGVGGMGVVVAAHHVDLDEAVAIKFLLPEILHNQDAVLRFAREARAAVKIKSEHVAKVTDVGKLENGAPYMVMEYLEGSDLAAWLGREGPLPVELAVEFVLQASEAIAEAHALGIVHRDLKPGNLFVIRRPDGALSIKVLDFGISKMTGRPGAGGSGSMTATSALMGSPLYMSPEQMQSSKDVDSRSDLWALGVILHELLAGTPPFEATTMPELVLRVVQDPPTRLRDRRPDVPLELEQVILKCLSKARHARYENIGELAVALLPFGPKRARVCVDRIAGVMRSVGFSGATTAVAPSADSEDQGVQVGTAASWGNTRAPTSRSAWRLVAGGGAAITVAALAWRVIHSSDAGRDTVNAGSASLSDSTAQVVPAAASANPITIIAAEPNPSAAPPVGATPVIPRTSPVAASSSAKGQDAARGPSPRIGEARPRSSATARRAASPAGVSTAARREPKVEDIFHDRR